MNQTKVTAFEPNCTSHCVGQNDPACTGGGHCVIGVMHAQRPTREDMLNWLSLSSSYRREDRPYGKRN